MQFRRPDSEHGREFCAKRKVPPSLQGEQSCLRYVRDVRTDRTQVDQVARTLPSYFSLPPILLLPALQILTIAKNWLQSHLLWEAFTAFSRGKVFSSVNPPEFLPIFIAPHSVATESPLYPLISASLNYWFVCCLSATHQKLPWVKKS